VTTLLQAWDYARQHDETFWLNVAIHVELSLLAVALGALVGIATGIALTRYRPAAFVVTNVAATGRTIPTLAILAMLLPILGIGFRPALVALTLIAVPPILINTYVGVTEVDQSVVEAARGMGMGTWELLRKIELPLVVPVVFAGLRTSAVQVVASATLATFIGGGGLGDFIQAGIAVNDIGQILVGAVPVAVGAIGIDWVFGLAERLLTPRGLRARAAS
jgi:osmoprotectant transport system permease protein